MTKVVLLIRNVAGDGYGGGEIYQIRLANKLVKEGFSPVIVTNSKKLLDVAKSNRIRTLESPYLKQQNWSGWRNILLPIYSVMIFRLSRWYKKVFSYYKPEIINIESRDDYLAATRVAKRLGIRVIWTDHADFLNWVLWNVNARFKNLIGKRIIKLSKDAERVIFVSKNVEEETKKMISPKKLCNAVVIQNGVEDRKKEYDNIKEKSDSFVFIGRVVEEKGIRELVEAFNKVNKKFQKAELNIYGDGEIEKYKQKYGNYNNVHFYGRTNEVLRVLAENEAFVLPSFQEGLSLALLEAAMMKKKIIVTDVGGNTEVVEDMKTGLVVPKGNTEKLAEAMERMLSHKKEAEKMAENARRRYEERFDFDKIFVEKMLPLYNKEKEKK